MLRKMFLVIAVVSAVSGYLLGLPCWAIPSAGLEAWLKADSISGADGQSIANWPNSAGTGTNYDGRQTTAAFQPKWYSNVVRGQPALRFDGSDDELGMAHTPMHGLTNFTIFAVVNKSSAGGDVHGHILGNRDYVGGVAIVGMGMYVIGNNDLGVGFNKHSFCYMNGTDRDKNSIRTTPTDSLPTDSFHVVSASWSTFGTPDTWIGYPTNNPTVYIDSIGPQNLRPWTDWPAFAFNNWQAWENGDAHGLGIGNGSAPYSHDAAFLGDIAELIFYNGILSEANRVAVQTYLLRKYTDVIAGTVIYLQ